jgi:hypothetical protein
MPRPSKSSSSSSSTEVFHKKIGAKQARLQKPTLVPSTREDDEKEEKQTVEEETVPVAASPEKKIKKKKNKDKAKEKKHRRHHAGVSAKREVKKISAAQRMCIRRGPFRSMVNDFIGNPKIRYGGVGIRYFQQGIEQRIYNLLQSAFKLTSLRGKLKLSAKDIIAALEITEPLNTELIQSIKDKIYQTVPLQQKSEKEAEKRARRAQKKLDEHSTGSTAVEEEKEPNNDDPMIA